MTSDTERELLEKAAKPAQEALRLHPLYHGKVQVLPKCPVRDMEDFAIWYTPGVAAPCRAIAADPDRVYDHTNKANSIAIVSDGTRVLGLGDIGPAAGLPVMEGKALLFKYLGGVDAVPLCLAAPEPERLIDTVLALQPSFGGINLEDIAQPKCFRILEHLRAHMQIPVWHDDQQGTATVVLAALLNALTLVGKSLDRIQIAMIGFGAANVATYRLLKAYGVAPAAVVACDSRGTLHRGRADIDERREQQCEKWQACGESNAAGVRGGIAEALRGADVCIALAAPGIIEPAWIRGMARDAIVLACANPVPEIWPWQAREAGARIVATGRSDFPNQVNNSLGFPGIFRGALDVRARSITDEMAIAAAEELARYARHNGLREDYILPTMAQWEAVPHVAAAVGSTAQEQGLAAAPMQRDELVRAATARIGSARRATQLLMREGLIADPGEPAG